MWILASIPFWIIALACLFIGLSCTAAGISTPFYEGVRRSADNALAMETYFVIGMGFLVMAGLAALIAAKIAA